MTPVYVSFILSAGWKKNTLPSIHDTDGDPIVSPTKKILPRGYVLKDANGTVVGLAELSHIPLHAPPETVQEKAF